MDNAPRFVDAQGRPFQLGEELGKGGEGRVYAVEGESGLVAKLYHQRPLPREVLEKLQAMIACRTSRLDAISAWPSAVLCDPRSREVMGLLMPRVVESHQLHLLYGTANRRRTFPDARWHHLLLAARNVAAAFQSMHAAGIVVGDVNQGNLLVDKRMCVRFIDCDSFQIEANGQLFACPVGTPHFTPPELQSLKLRDVQRTPEHDAFGMAVLIFHLLFVGRHPFAGRFLGSGELTIEQAIAERRFAFSRNRSETLVDPPPASLKVDDLPAEMANLFERAFRAQPDGDERRPTAREWVDQLESLIKQRAQCSFDQVHVYYNRLSRCPWCRIEEEGGPAFFVGDAGVSMISASRLDHLDQKLRNLEIPAYVDLAPARLSRLHPLKPKKSGPRFPVGVSDALAAAIAFFGSLCMLGVKVPWALPLSALGMVAAGAGLIFLKPCAEQRLRAQKLQGVLANFQVQLVNLGRKIAAKYQARKAAFETSVGDLKQAYQHYQSGGANLRDVLVWQRADQMNRFLASHLLQEHAARAGGLDVSLLSVLQSYGVESALDVDKVKLLGIPLLAPGVTIELVNWREQVERSFKFKPEHDVSIEDAEQAGERAIQRFRTSQARKVLMGAKQLQAMADVGRADLNRDLKAFDDLHERGKKAAVQLRDFQSGRRVLERSLNSSPLVTAAIVVGFPAVCWVFKALIGG